jgi:hypothetical protein
LVELVTATASSISISRHQHAYWNLSPSPNHEAQCPSSRHCRHRSNPFSYVLSAKHIYTLYFTFYN